MSNQASIFVTGGTGFLGSYLLRYLVKSGANIRALKRASSSMALVKEIEDQIEWIEGDILDTTVLSKAMRGIEQVYHCAAIISFDYKMFDTMQQVNVEGTANMVNIAIKQGIKKMVYVSSIAALGRSKEQKQVNEKTHWQQDALNSNYAISKYLAEQEVWRGIAEGLTAAIVNPSVILGSGFWEQGSTQLFHQVWKGLRFFPIGGSGFVDVRDVARFSIALMDSDIKSERFIINGANLSYKELFSTIAIALQKKPPSIKVAPFLQSIAWRIAWLGARLTGKSPMITRESTALIARTFIYQNEKSLQYLKTPYTPIKETIEQTAIQLLEASKNNYQANYLPLN